MRTPSLNDLAAPHRDAALQAARNLAGAGYQAWLVGGAVRDLALGRLPKDIDLATDAQPDQVEACFERTIPVGKAFGTIVVLIEAAQDRATIELQITTLRRDGEYRDGRHPDRVRYGTSLEEDALRRDFTCNAIFIELLGNRVQDPCGGLGDLDKGLLRCVGDPGLRFQEDGLRLLRLARFAAAFGMQVEEQTWQGALASLRALDGISRERLLMELVAMAQRPNPARALHLLHAMGVLQRIFPGAQPEHWDGVVARIEAQLTKLGDAPGAELFLAVLFWPDSALQDSVAASWLESLRPSRTLSAAIRGLWSAANELLLLASDGEPIPESWRSRARLIRVARTKAFQPALQVLRAGHLETGTARGLDRLEAQLAAMAPSELRPDPFLQSADLERAGIPRGPLWGKLLVEAEERLLGRADQTRAEALAWLAKRSLEESS